MNARDHLLGIAPGVRANAADAAPRSHASHGAEFHRLRPSGFDRISRHDEEGVSMFLDELRASAAKYVRAFCIAVAVFAAVYFGLQLLRGVL